jgi:DNA-binding NtrC family response regulator
MADSGRILIVDDEPNALRVLAAILETEGYRVDQARDVESAVAHLAEADFDSVITDMKMGSQTGLDLFEHIQGSAPDLPVIFLTAYGTVESAVGAVTRGAYYYFIKPPDYTSLKAILGKAVEQRRLKRELAQLKRQLAQGRPRAVCKSPAMREVEAVLEVVRDSDTTVLIGGETGSGKELIARSLHDGSARRSHPFIPVNCAAIPRELIESELFGAEKGAYTGAVARRIGKVEQAAGGTLFLDEIGEIDLSIQAKLLRVLQDKEIERLGGKERIRVDFRLVTATNRDLAREVAAGKFREDLYYRLNVVPIQVPPLRERPEDLPLLITEFLAEFCSREGKVLTLSEKALARLLDYAWPGNVRQLRNVIERMVVLARGKTLLPAALPAELTGPSEAAPAPTRVTSLRELEEQATRQALEQCGGNKSEVARLLGISRKALYKKLKDFAIE